MKRKIVIASLLALLLASSQAWAVAVGGRNISTIPDILKATRSSGITSNTNAELELEKPSLLRLFYDGKFKLFYNIGSGDVESELGTIKDFQNYKHSNVNQEQGLLSAISKTKFDGSRIVIGSSGNLFEKSTSSNRFYDIYFLAVQKDDDDDKVIQERIGAWRYPKVAKGTTSGYLKDIKTGIFVQGFDGELVVTATMEATNDNLTAPVLFNTKKAIVRLDFWALGTNASGDLQYKKIDTLNKTQEGYETKPLYEVKNLRSEYANNRIYFDSTPSTVPPYMLIKVAVGDFNHDGYENEVAVLTADKNNIKFTVYQIRYENKQFSMSTMANQDLYKYNNVSRGSLHNQTYNGHNRAPGAEILAGDFDGDGKTEIAAVYQGDFTENDYNSPKSRMFRGGTAVDLYTNIYKWNTTNGKFDATVNRQVEYGMSYKFDEKLDSIITGHSERTFYLPWGGIKAVVLDIDGDGTDEIAVAGARTYLYEKRDMNGWKKTQEITSVYEASHYMTLVQRDKSDGKLKPANTYTYAGKTFTSEMRKREADLRDTDLSLFTEFALAPVKTDENLFPLVEREIVLTAGPFYASKGKGKLRDDLAMRVYSDRGPILIIFKSDGSTLKEEKNLPNFWGRMGRLFGVNKEGLYTVVAGDFAGEGVSLGTPTHVINQSDKSFMAILQAPPYHVDNISEDGQSLTLTPVNFSYVKGASVKYEKSSNESEQKNTKFDIHNTVETIFAIDSDVTRNIIGGYKKVRDVYGLVKTAAGFIPAEVKSIKKADGVVSKITNFLDSCIDKIDYIKQGFDKTVTTTVALKGIQTERLDMIQYVASDQNIWRYPILTTPAPFWGIDYTSTDKYVTKQDYLTFSLYDELKDNTVQNASFYQPTHENGNLFSYPSSVENIEGYGTRQKRLTKQNSVVELGTTTTTHTLQFDNVKEHEETKSKKVTKGFISEKLSLIDGIFGTKLANVPKNETSPTYTRTESSGEKIIFNLPNADGVPLVNGFKYEYGAWVADNGAVMCGFAVNDLKREKTIFSPQSLYGQYPDPSFVLPYKFTLLDRNLTRPSFQVNSNRLEAMSMRGVRFYAIDFNRYTSNRLLDGARYRVEIPLYNASFKEVSGVKVKLYWTDKFDETGVRTPIGESQAITMPGWSDYGNNKAWAHIEFTPNINQGNYKLYALIDYAGEEVHKNRDLATDPGGNNEGFFDFSVVKAEAAKDYAASLNSLAFRASAEGDDINLPTMTYNGKSTWAEFYEEYIAKTEGPVQMKLSLTNNMDVMIPDVEIRLIYIDQDLANAGLIEEAIGDACFAQNIMLFPHETYEFTVTLDDDLADTLREVGRTNTSCSYVISDAMLRLAMGNEPYDEPLDGDDDPELEAAADDDEEDEDEDDVQLVETVITKTYSLSCDTPVFWRVENVYETALDYDTEETYDDSSYVEDSGAGQVRTADDEEFDGFNVSISPSTAGTVKTNEVTITASTIAGETIKTDYGFNVQVSEDGETWDDFDFLIFSLSGVETTDNTKNTTQNPGTGPVGSGGSSGGCDSMSMAFGLVALAFMLKRKA